MSQPRRTSSSSSSSSLLWQHLISCVKAYFIQHAVKSVKDIRLSVSVLIRGLWICLLHFALTLSCCRFGWWCCRARDRNTRLRWDRATTPNTQRVSYCTEWTQVSNWKQRQIESTETGFKWNLKTENK
jgi:hypothetical protein